MNFWEITAENNLITISYNLGYENNYNNTIVINCDNFKYTSLINDSKKDELFMVFDRLWKKLEFSDKNTLNCSLVELYNSINNGLIQLLEHKNELDEQIIQELEDAKFYSSSAIKFKVNKLANQYQNYHDEEFNLLLLYYYDLYVTYGNNLIELDNFTINNQPYKIVNNQDYKGNLDNQAIRDYIKFSKIFIFQLEDDLKHLYKRDIDL